MQCMNCQFENVPGITHCVLCQSTLNLDDVAVAPPRASRWALGTAWHRRWHALRSAMRAIRRACLRKYTTTYTPVRWEAVVWSLIPGMGFIKYGNKLTGHLLLGGWSLMFLLFLVELGRVSGEWCLAVAVLLHAAGMLAFLGAELSWHGVITRALLGILLFVGLRFVLYQPVFALARGLYVPMQVQGLLAGSIVENGDTILYEGRWLRPEAFQRGDTVVYEIHAVAGHMYYLQGGFGLDRVVAVPGDRVDMRSHVLYVNDQPADDAQLPLGKGNMWQMEDPILLGPGEYLIFPSLLPMWIHGRLDTQHILRSLSLVNGDDIRGRVVYRTHPWSRFGGIE